MKKQKKHTGLKILIVVICLSVIAIIITSLSKTSIFSSALGFITTPLQNISTQFSNSAFGEMKESYQELSDKNSELEQKSSELLQHKSEYYELKRENEQYKNMLGLKEQNTDYEFASASVIGRDPAELYFGLTINQGSLDGISLYDPVITDRGLVGYISEVYSSYSKVTTILSPDANVSAIDQVSLVTGILNGNISSSDNKMAYMKYVSEQDNVSFGDIIVTSGLGGVYPDNLLIGEVDTISRQENSVDLVVTVKPYEDIENVMNVFVITNFIGQGLI